MPCGGGRGRAAGRRRHFAVWTQTRKRANGALQIFPAASRATYPNICYFMVSANHFIHFFLTMPSSKRKGALGAVHFSM